MRSDRTLIAGPWVGEFGWELFAWHGYVRALSRKFKKTISISRPNSKHLYEDFSDCFYSHTPVGGIVDSFFMHHVDLSKEFKKVVIENNIDLQNATVLLPRRIGAPPFTHHTQPIKFGSYEIQPEYKIFGSSNKSKFDYIFHIRQRKTVRPEDNWDINKWLRLRDLLDSNKIACVGTKAESGHIDGTTDLRDVSLQNLFDSMYNVKCVFGPSSGPMHLASLCNAPHVVWSASSNQKRYEENWNPHGSKVLFLDKFDWHPSANYVYNKFLNWSDK